MPSFLSSSLICFQLTNLALEEDFFLFNFISPVPQAIIISQIQDLKASCNTHYDEFYSKVSYYKEDIISACCISGLVNFKPLYSFATIINILLQRHKRTNDPWKPALSMRIPVRYFISWSPSVLILVLKKLSVPKIIAKDRTTE